MSANKMFEAKAKLFMKENNAKPKHKSSFQSGDMQKLLAAAERDDGSFARAQKMLLRPQINYMSSRSHAIVLIVNQYAYIVHLFSSVGGFIKLSVVAVTLSTRQVKERSPC